jgi:hypothetical protein
MSHYFLPVNPCCTNVVNPCGCSSTTSNTGPCNTTLTASSTIAYDGLALSCTTIEPSNTLNVVLQKIDEVICNLLGQINTLTTEVDTLNSQITIINGDIIYINNILDICCPNVTTTTTSSSSSTSTSTSTSSTSTSTTTATPTTTTTTTVVSYLYRITQYNCGTCEDTGSFLRANTVPLNVNQFYYDDFSNKVIQITEFIETQNVSSEFNVNTDTEQSNCFAVICPTTTTTTTLAL